MSRHRDQSTRQHGSSRERPTHTLLQIYHSPNATLVLLRATWAWYRLACPQGSARFLPPCSWR